VAGRNPDPHTRGNRDHRSARNVAVTKAAVAAAPIVTRILLASSTTIVAPRRTVP
jgi:hypothetical protein